MTNTLYSRRIGVRAGICSALALPLLLAAGPLRAQHAILDGHFTSGGGVRDGTGHRVHDTIGLLSGAEGSASGSYAVRTGFWHLACLNSTVEVAITAFACEYRDDEVRLSWELMADGEPAGINVYRGLEGEDPARINDSPLQPAARSYADRTALPGRTYLYQLEVLGADGSAARSILQSLRLPPRPLTLSQNYPNPFNPSTTIGFYMPAGGRARLAIYDVGGERVRTLVDGALGEGVHTVTWNGTNDRGRDVGTGVYLYILETGKKRITKKLVLLR